MLSYDIQEDGDNRGVNDVGKHRADDGHNQEGLDRVTVLIANRAHVCHRVGGGTEASFFCDLGVAREPTRESRRFYGLKYIFFTFDL